MIYVLSAWIRHTFGYVLTAQGPTFFKLSPTDVDLLMKIQLADLDSGPTFVVDPSTVSTSGLRFVAPAGDIRLAKDYSSALGPT